MKKIKSKAIFFVTCLTILFMGCPIISNAASITTTFKAWTGKATYTADWVYDTEKHVTVWLYDSNGGAFTTATKTANNVSSVSVSKFSTKATKAYGVGYEVNWNGDVVAYQSAWN